MLESQVAELTKKLQDAEALVGGSGGVGSSGGSGDGGSGGGGALVPGGTGSVSSSASPSPQFSSTSSTVGSHHHQHHQQHQHQHPQFVASLKDYLHRMGYHFPASSSPDYRPAAAASPQAGNGSGSCSAGPGGLGGCGNSAEQPRQPADGSPVRVPLLSELPTSNTLPVDLRMFLPPKGFAVQLSDVFRRTIQAYTPLFCWPLFLEECFERAWSRPVWREDARAVKGVFCVLQMVLAVACQMAPPESPELAEIAGGAEVQERSVKSLVVFAGCVLGLRLLAILYSWPCFFFVFCFFSFFLSPFFCCFLVFSSLFPLPFPPLFLLVVSTS